MVEQANAPLGEWPATGLQNQAHSFESSTALEIWEYWNCGRFRETVNLLPFGFGGSNPSTPTK